MVSPSLSVDLPSRLPLLYVVLFLVLSQLLLALYLLLAPALAVCLLLLLILALLAPPIETRRSIEDSFPACPSNWIRAGRTLSAIGTSGEERVTRAWLAGCWAKAVLDNRIGSPNRSSACRLQNRFWVVLFCQGLETPRVFTSSRSFFAAVGRVEGSDTLCHGFASATETYLEAAGFAFPLSLN